jgi:HD-like signal output (HDOD) protein
LNQAVSDGVDLLACERESFGVDHAELAGQIAENWNLPVEIITAVATHHHSEGPSSAWALGIKEACFAAEYAGFGKCGSHNHLADDITGLLAELSEPKFLSEVLPIKLNSIECSLL